LLYHGVKQMVSGPVYRVGLALLDRDQPWHAVARTDEWVFAPETPYERSGDVPNVVFPCGALLRGGEVWMYYGAADSTVCLATARLDELLAAVTRPSPV
ncbi:MAG TPA: glycosidase, partial [Candidatus Limnocylindrales bacterium]|nr:glycosidase [Candidatus Limnocylindrales bacterium]